MVAQLVEHLPMCHGFKSHPGKFSTEKLWMYIFAFSCILYGCAVVVLAGKMKLTPITTWVIPGV